MWDSAKDSKMFAWNYDSHESRLGRRQEAVRRVRRLHRRLGHRGRALHGRHRRVALVSAAACSAAAPTTGAASRCASAPTTSAARSIDGFGDDWPITYDDMKPYYDKLDQFVGIFGTNHAAQTGLHNEPDGIFLPPPKPRALRAADQAGVRQAEDSGRAVAPVDPHQAAQRPRRLSLLRPVRPRLRHALELLEHLGDAAAGAQDRQADDHRQRDGARGDDRRRGPGHRRLLHRHAEEHRAPGAGQGGRAGGELLRVGAAAAQLQVDAPSRAASPTRAASSAST